MIKKKRLTPVSTFLAAVFVPGWLLAMNKKQTFGDLTAEDFEVGDIVGWKIWDDKNNDWISQYGLLLEIQNELRSNRVVSISKVMPLNEPHVEREFFTLTLEIINKS